MRSYCSFNRRTGERKCREFSGSLCGADVDDVGGVAGGDALDAFGDGVTDIQLSIKYRKGLR